MAEAVRAGRFREDLFYRLNVFPLEIPPLRERPGDIVPLARKLLAELATLARQAAKFTAAAEARLLAYAWPGNVRELQSVVQRALILATDELIDAEELPLDRIEVASLVLSSALDKTGKISGAELLPAAASPAPIFSEASATVGTPASPANMKVLERQHILEILMQVNGSRKKAVAILGISERTLRYKLNQYRTEGFFTGREYE